MLTKTEYDNIFKYFDKNCDDEVSFAEFIQFLRGILLILVVILKKIVPLNENRNQIVNEIFDLLDQQK